MAGGYGPIIRNRCGAGTIWDPEARKCISLTAYRRKYGNTGLAKNQLDYSKVSPELTRRRRDIG